MLPCAYTFDTLGSATNNARYGSVHACTPVVQPTGCEQRANGSLHAHALPCAFAREVCTSNGTYNLTIRPEALQPAKLLYHIRIHIRYKAYTLYIRYSSNIYIPRPTLVSVQCLCTRVMQLQITPFIPMLQCHSYALWLHLHCHQGLAALQGHTLLILRFWLRAQ